MKTKKRVAFEYLVLGLLCALVACAISVLWADWREGQTANWRPGGDLLSIAASIWFALLIHAVLPTGWCFWTGFAFALRKKKAWFYLAAIVPSIVVGWLWPSMFWALMSV
jgi:hypothetical protein